MGILFDYISMIHIYFKRIRKGYIRQFCEYAKLLNALQEPKRSCFCPVNFLVFAWTR